MPWVTSVLLDAAATIEALQAQLAELAPASADTRELRTLAEILDANGHVDGQFLRDVADSLDASRAECERLREAGGNAAHWINRLSDEIETMSGGPRTGLAYAREAGRLAAGGKPTQHVVEVTDEPVGDDQ